MTGYLFASLCNMTGKAVKLPQQLQAWEKKIIGNYPSGSADILQPFEFRLMEESGE